MTNVLDEPCGGVPAPPNSPANVPDDPVEPPGPSAPLLPGGPEAPERRGDEEGGAEDD